VSYYSLSLGGIQILTAPDATFSTPWRFLLAPAGLTGWRTRAQDATDVSPHWSGAGSVAGSTSIEGRQLIIEGYVQGKLPGSVEEGLDAIARLSKTTLTVGEDVRALVRVSDVRVTQMQESRLSATLAKVTLNLTADDPLRYSAESRLLVNGTTWLPNRGDAWAAPRLALAGTHGALTISHHAGTWAFPALASGDSRLIDFREGRTWDDSGARVFGAGAGTGPVPKVGPGAPTWWTVSGLGAGTAILTRCEAWS